MDIFVINWSGKEFLGRCLRALSHLKYPSYRITLLTHRSEISAAPLLEENPSLRIFRLKRNIVHAEALNRALEMVSPRASYVAFVDSDVEVEPGWARALISAAREDARGGVLIPKILFGSAPRIIFSYGVRMGRCGRIWNELTGKLDSATFAGGVPVSSYWGASLFTRSVTDELGAFDEGFGPHYDMVDYCLRAMSAGYSRVAVPEARAYIASPVSIRESLAKSAHLVNQARIIHLHYPPGRAISGAAALLATVLFDRKGKRMAGSDLPDRLCRPKALAGILASTPPLALRRMGRFLRGHGRPRLDLDYASEPPIPLRKYHPSPACDRAFPARILMGVSDFFLGEGWSKLQRDYLGGYPAIRYRRISKKASAYLTVDEEGPALLQICLSAPAGRPLVLKVSINGEFRGIITVKDPGWKTYHIPLAASKGVSEIAFETDGVSPEEKSGDSVENSLKVSEIGIFAKGSPFIRGDFPSVPQ